MSVRVGVLLACASAAMICAAKAADMQSPLPNPAPPPLQSPWYVEGSAGVFWRMDSSSSTTIRNIVTGVTGPGTNTNTYDPGAAVYLGLGYRLPAGFRIEGELGYARYRSATTSPLSTNGAFPLLNGNQLSLVSGGDHNRYSAMINGYYDLPLSGWIVPYIGTGVGVVVSQGQTSQFAGPGVLFTQNGNTVTNAAIAAEGGLTIALSPAWSAVPAYRFEHTFNTGTQFPNDASIFKLGFRHSL